MEPKNFNEELKKAESEAKLGRVGNEDGTMKLDDTQRVKVLSPGRLVIKRFVRNKLAIVGASILAFMFIFCFLGPLFYPYHQTQKFYKTDILQNASYASARERTTYSAHKLAGGDDVHRSVVNMVNSHITNNMEPNQLTQLFVFDDGGANRYLLQYEADSVYSLYDTDLLRVGQFSLYLLIGEYDSFLRQLVLADGVTLGEAFTAAAEAAIQDKLTEFEYDGVSYTVENAGAKKYHIKQYADHPLLYDIEPIGAAFEAAAKGAIESKTFRYEGDTYTVSDATPGTYRIDRVTIGNRRYIYSPYTINLLDDTKTLSTAFLREALVALVGDETFEFEGETYTIGEEDGEINLYRGEAPYGIFTTFSVSRSNGSGALPIAFKNDLKAKVNEMIDRNVTSDTLLTQLELQNSDGSIARDEDGKIIYVDTEVSITRKGNEFEVRCDRLEYLIDIYGRPMSTLTSDTHLIGTDGDGYDVLSRIMYGGRVSLMVGFIVVIIEIILGVIMGGISGYFGGWVDTLIMRLVDIFYCIPTMPVLIIIGALFDAVQMESMTRLMWMMVVLGFLGWAGVARMVRGQILSLREQEFMVATEVGGLRVSRRIFRHLIPNVMPQLIVNATAGLGSVILTESVLSFLGLGVKHPLASWGSMINSVSDYSSMINYTYIWVPVGLLICLTVIAFNFVGDGLRDAFDPKMKR
ncbi:MAG: ABC transporter permease [Eubacteriales bacterium]